MNSILLVVIVLQFSYMVFSDIQNRKEREMLQLKLMSKDLSDYKSNTDGTPEESSKQEENPYVSMDEVSIEQLLKTKEK